MALGQSGQEYKWGGMSGSLVYRLDENDNLFKPCGIMHGARDGLDTAFFATHLDFIQEDCSSSLSYSKPQSPHIPSQAPSATPPLMSFSPRSTTASGKQDRCR